MIKRFLNSFAHAAGWGAGTVVGARGGNDAYDWVKSGEAKKALGRLAKKGAEVARDVKDELSDASEEVGEAVREGVQQVRARFGTGEADTGSSSGAAEAEEEQLSEEDRSALRQRAAVATKVVHCTHCDGPVTVPVDAELAKCSGCNQRFWIELADHD